MIKSIFILISILALKPASASATMYLAAYDPSTRAIGLVYSSSGGHFWQTLVKGKGLAGAQNYGLCEQATPGDFLKAGFTAPEIAIKVKAQCDAVDYHTYRFLVITADGQIDYVIGRDGCSIPECGAVRGKNVVMTGGGLKPGVLQFAIQSYEQQALDHRLSFTCRLLNTLKEIYAAGGEEAEFAGASITVDQPQDLKLINVQARATKLKGQQNLLTSLQNQLKAQGEDCTAVSN